MRYRVSLLVLIFSIVGCTSNQALRDSSMIVPLVNDKESNVETRIREEYKRWENTPHKFGGNDINGVDCSGLVHQVYKNTFQIKIPRTTQTLIKVGVFIKRLDLQAGDLVFFKLPPPSYPRHVGIYLGSGEFMHASNKGVIISRLDTGYWNQFYQTARRPHDYF